MFLGTDTTINPACAIVVPKEKIVLIFNAPIDIKIFYKAIRPLCEKANPARRGLFVFFCVVICYSHK